MKKIICKNCECELPKTRLPVTSGENIDCNCPIWRKPEPIEVDKNGSDL